MNYFRRCIGIGLFAITGLAHATVTINLEDATNGGGFFGVVTIDDIVGGVNITADIRDPINPGLTQGDILGLWFDFANFGALGTPTIASFTSPPVLDFDFGNNTVGTQPFSDMNINLNGTGEDNWDLAVQVGEGGAAGGFNQLVMFDFILTGLNEGQFVDQRVGMRVQSIVGGSFGSGSSKLLGQVPEPATLGMLGAGLLGLAFARRKRRV